MLTLDPRQVQSGHSQGEGIFIFTNTKGGVGGFNLAAKGTFLEEIGALLVGIKIHVFEFWSPRV